MVNHTLGTAVQALGPDSGTLFVPVSPTAAVDASVLWAVDNLGLVKTFPTILKVPSSTQDPNAIAAFALGGEQGFPQRVSLCDHLQANGRFPGKIHRVCEHPYRSIGTVAAGTDSWIPDNEFYDTFWFEYGDGLILPGLTTPPKTVLNPTNDVVMRHTIESATRLVSIAALARSPLSVIWAWLKSLRTLCGGAAEGPLFAWARPENDAVITALEACPIVSGASYTLGLLRPSVISIGGRGVTVIPLPSAVLAAMLPQLGGTITANGLLVARSLAGAVTWQSLLAQHLELAATAILSRARAIPGLALASEARGMVRGLAVSASVTPWMSMVLTRFINGLPIDAFTGYYGTEAWHPSDLMSVRLLTPQGSFKHEKGRKDVTYASTDRVSMRVLAPPSDATHHGGVGMWVSELVGGVRRFNPNALRVSSDPIADSVPGLALIITDDKEFHRATGHPVALFPVLAAAIKSSSPLIATVDTLAIRYGLEIQPPEFIPDISVFPLAGPQLDFITPGFAHALAAGFGDDAAVSAASLKAFRDAAVLASSGQGEGCIPLAHLVPRPSFVIPALKAAVIGGLKL